MTDVSRAEEVFLAALERAAPADRDAFLAAACGGDAGLRRRVDRLLAAHQKSATFLESPAVRPPDPAPGAGAVLAGRYTLVEKIGEGGMGAVWLAEQAAPLRRRVAVKLIKPGLASAAILARFDAERDALARMDHPNIARVFDGGVAPDGRPFLTMELVKGVPITQFADARRLTPRQRLELFVPVCRAVQHAHQKGVIHRDLKPSNVLVALYDDVPVPKVIDFGLARPAAADPDWRAVTAFDTVVGSPAYMSPEQATLNNLDVDTRSDVYSLGVLLYELLAGSPPFAEAELREAGLLEILRHVREVEPPRPSRKVSTSAARPQVSAARSTEPAALSRLLRADLDWVVLKALEKDRARRYESAGGFAADVERYLADEPVEAHPPGRWYRVRKLVRRNRAAAAGAAALVLALALGAAGTTAGMVEARRQEGIARAAYADEHAARRQAEATLRSFTHTHAELIQSVLNFDWLQQASPVAVKENLTNRLDAEVRAVDASGITDPEARHELRSQLALAYRKLGLPEPALAQGRLALAAAEGIGPDRPEVVQSLVELSLSLRLAGRADEAGAARARAAAVARVLPPPASDADRRVWLRVAGYLHEYGKEPDLAARFVEHLHAAALAAHGPRHPDTLRQAHQLAWVRMRQGRPAEALAVEREAVAIASTELGPTDPRVVQMLLDAHQLMLDAGRTDPVLLAAVRTSLGPDRVGDGLLAIEGLELLKAARWAEAEVVLRDCLAAREKLRPGHWTTSNTRSMLGAALLGQGRHAEAEPLLTAGFEGLAAREAAVPAAARHRLGEAADRLVELAEALGRADDARRWRAERAKYP